MIRLERILVPVDFSDNSAKAVRYGMEIAKDRNAELCIIHVINQRNIDAIQELSLKGYKGDFVQAVRTMVANREKELREFVPESAQAGFKVSFEIRKGKPADELIRFAQEGAIDLIIVGTTGRSALEVALIGSVARNLVNHAPCPVLVVRPTEHDFVR